MKTRIQHSASLELACASTWETLWASYLTLRDEADAASLRDLKDETDASQEAHRAAEGRLLHLAKQILSSPAPTLTAYVDKVYLFTIYSDHWNDFAPEEYRHGLIADGRRLAGLIDGALAFDRPEPSARYWEAA